MLDLRCALPRWLATAVAALAPMLPAAAPGDLHLVSRIELPDLRGRLDHLAYAPDANLLFVAALGADAVQVVDLAASRATVRLRASEPQGLSYSPALHRLYVANGRAGTVEAFEGSARVAVARGLPDADNLRLDERSGLLYVGFGRAVAALDMRSLAVVHRYALPGHPEAFELSDHRIDVNVPTARAVIALDRETGTSSTWSVAPAGENFPLVVAPSAHRLFVATRRPAELLVLDADNGAHLARIPICADADDLFLLDRLYAACGDGHIDVIRATEPYRVDQRVPTAEGARTALLVPTSRRLFVAAPARQGRQAAVLVFQIE